jgi:translation initiation factor IF-1
MKTTPPAGKKLSFQSKLENWAEGMDYCAIPVPAKVTQTLGTKSAVLVMAQVNGSEPFKVSLFPAGGGQHYIRVRAKVRKEAKLKEGDRVKVQVIVLDRADVTIPKDLMAALRAEKATKDFDSLPPGKKNYAIRRIDDASKPETRAKRVQEAVELAHEARERKSDRGR